MNETTACKSMFCVLLALATLVLGGCSLIKLSYNHLDTLVGWKIDDYVDFNDAQQQQFDQAFNALWAWHRHTQLPVYAKALRRIATATGKPSAPKRIDQWITRAEQLGKAVARRAQAPTESLLRTLSDAQVQYLIKALEQDRRERADKLADRSAKQRRDKRESKMRDRIEDWIGDLDATQVRRLRAWVEQRHPTADLQLAVSRAWNARAARVLATRRQAGFDQRFVALFTDDGNAEQQRLSAIKRKNTALLVSLISDLSAQLSPEQRRYLQGRLRSLADKLQELSEDS